MRTDFPELDPRLDGRHVVVTGDEAHFEHWD